MTILGIGADIVHAPRVAAILTRRGSRFPSRILSGEEFSRWSALPANDRVRFLAVRWSVKEAVYKALYPARRPTWKELTYATDGEGKPTLRYHPQNEAHADYLRILVSVSHDGDYILSSALVEAHSRTGVPTLDIGA